MKNFSFNLFLFTILMGLLFMPLASFKLLKTTPSGDVLGTKETETKYLEQRIINQEKRIKELESKREQGLLKRGRPKKIGNEIAA